MAKHDRGFSIVLILVFLAGAAFAQAPIKQNKKQTIVPLTGSNPVVGSGTPGQITKWTGINGSTTFVVGDSYIFEDKFGKIGIGTHTPTSPLTVQGMIETTLGGIKFPDGTTQTTSAAGALFGVNHDTTLQGNGTLASPLGVAVPLNLTGSSAPPILNVVNGNGDGLRGASTDNAGVRGDSSTSVGVRGDSVSDIGVLGNGLGSGNGVRGNSVGGNGVSGHSISASGVRGEGLTGVSAKGNDNTSTSGTGGIGVFAQGGDSADGSGGVGLYVQGGHGGGSTSFGGDAIFAISGGGPSGVLSNGLAGSFLGNVDVQGKLTKTMGTFKIDHPLDPENKYLYHSFVESPDMMNIYNGNITTDSNGEAVVEMPDYFDALNKDFRYQLTVIGTFAQAIVASKMKGNRFVIRTSAPNVEVSWMVTGVRQDAFANKNRVQVEVDKSEKERGHYLHPEVFNQPEEKSIEWGRHPEIMQRLKQQRVEAEEKSKKQQ